MIESAKKILVVAAHPDDEVLGCGGTIARYASEGKEVFCLFLGGGKASRFEAEHTKELQRERAMIRKEAENAAKILGVANVWFEDFPDQKYDVVPLAKIIKTIKIVQDRVRPDIVFTHHPGDINLDHKIAYEAVMNACRTVCSFVIPAATEWAASFSFAPNVFVDIKESFEKRQKAMAAYQSELREYPHPRSLRSLEIIARYWGTMVGKEFVEAFELINA